MQNLSPIKKIKVLIIDDSAIVRKVLSEELSKFPDIEVVGTAIDPYVAREKIAQLNPDVLTLDLEMPRMDGLTFLQKLMKHHPLPVVVVSSLAPENSANALKALEWGAVDVVSKPGSAFSVPEVSAKLVRTIRGAAYAKLKSPEQIESADKPSLQALPFKASHQILALGASTGGTQALESILSTFPAHGPGTLIVQHMPEGFTKTFADRLNELCAMEVREAKDGDMVVPGVALLAPGGHHMILKREGVRYLVGLQNGPPVHYHRPSVDVLFYSVAKLAGRNAIGALLTGMGSDGARGLLAMRQAGAKTLAQDEASSVVFGMPKEAIAMGAAEKIVPLNAVASTIFGLLTKENELEAGRV